MALRQCIKIFLHLLLFRISMFLDFVWGNTEILGKQNSLFPSGPVIKCLLQNFYKHLWFSVHASVSVFLNLKLCWQVNMIDLWRRKTLQTNNNYCYHSMYFSFLINGRELTTWPANNCLQISVLLQIIFCSCVIETTLMWKWPISSEQAESDLIYLVDQKNGDRMIKQWLN